MKRGTALLLVLLLSLGSGSPVLADCCDSFFGCAAAYATDGLSCVLTELISTVKSLIDVMNNLTLQVSGNAQSASDAAQKYVSDTIAQTRSDAQQSSSDLAAAKQQADTLFKEETSLINPAQQKAEKINTGANAANASSATSMASTTVKPSAVTRPAGAQPAQQTKPKTEQLANHSAPVATTQPTTTGPPNSAQLAGGNSQSVVTVKDTLAAHGALRGLFEKSVAQIQKLKAAGDADYPKVTQLMNQAQQTEGPAVQSALAAADKAIKDPIRNILSRLANMLTDPTTIFDPTDIVNQVADSVLANLETNIGNMVDGITAGPQKAFDAAQPAQDELTGSGDKAKAIAAAMQRAFTERTEASQIALSQLLPMPTTAAYGKAETKTLVSTGARAPYTQVLSKFKANKIAIAPAVKQRMQNMGPLLAKFKTLHTQAIAAKAAAPTYRNNFTQKLNTTFANKTQAEINALRDQYIAQARNLYASNPKVRDQIIAVLNSETAKVRPLVKH